MSQILLKEARTTFAKVRSMKPVTMKRELATVPKIDKSDQNQYKDELVKKTRDLAKQTKKASAELLKTFPEDSRKSSSREHEGAESGPLTAMAGLPQFTSVWPHLW